MARTLLGIFALGLGACAAAPESGGPPAKPAATASTAAPSLTGTRWKGVIDASLDPAATPWLEFAEGRVSGFSGCNMLNGAWKSEGGQVRLGPIAMTKRGCIGPAGGIEQRVMRVLNDQARVVREGNKLVITNPNGDRFEFVLATS